MNWGHYLCAVDCAPNGQTLAVRAAGAPPARRRPVDERWLARLEWAARAFVGFVLVAGMLGAVPARALRAQPLLLELARSQPEALVSVIVQKLGTDASTEKLVAQLGGMVTRDLRIINAFAAELPAGAVQRLAAHPGVRWVSLDAPVVENSSASDGGKGGRRANGSAASAAATDPGRCAKCLSTASLKNAYNASIGASKLWNSAPYLQGQGVTLAVIDSGVAAHADITGRVIHSTEFSLGTTTTTDGLGHGTHIAGILAGNGSAAGGAYMGVAPKANLVNVKISDDQGTSTASDVVAGMQWILENKAAYNIRVVNISLNSAVAESYHTSPLCAAAEILWFNGIVVVVSAGNQGKNTLYPPANDPFVITVGAVNDMKTAGIGDDILAPYSGAGITSDGFAKPDLVAPGHDIIGPLASADSRLAVSYPRHVVKAGAGELYFRMSGTSMAAPVVAGAVALLLQDEPGLTPDQVKYRLMATAVNSTAQWPAYNAQKAGAGYLNAYAAVHGTTTTAANVGLAPSQLLTTGSRPTKWSSVNWNAVNWNAVNWNAVNWNAVNWNSDFFN